jgi:TPP-dependent pyruvate/acetoin dehydrogenase alpha subunit
MVAVIHDESASKVDHAVEKAREVPASDPMRMFDNHLHGTSWNERHQRQELRAELAGENPFVDFTGEGLE